MSGAAATAMRAIADARYISVESYKRDGGAVRTPVWFAVAPGDEPVFYVYTTDDSFKVKRIRRTPKVRLAVCDMRGGSLGAWIDARATIAGADEFAAGMRLLDRKYFPWKQLLGLGALFRRRRRVVITLRPANGAPVP